MLAQTQTDGFGIVLVIVAMALLAIAVYLVRNIHKSSVATTIYAKPISSLHPPAPEPSFVFTYRWNGTEYPSPLLPQIAVRFRDECKQALIPFAKTLEVAGGEVHIAVDCPVIALMKMSVRILGVEKDVQERIVAALPKELGSAQPDWNLSERIGARGGRYTLNNKGNRVYKKKQ